MVLVTEGEALSPKKESPKSFYLSKKELGILSKELELLEKTVVKFSGNTERFLLFRKLKNIFKQAESS